MPSESPTSSSGMPASSRSRAMGKSYAVRATIFSPPDFIDRIVSAVIFVDSMELFQPLAMSSCCLANELDCHCHCFAAADAERGNAQPFASLLQPVEQSYQRAGDRKSTRLNSS